MNNNNGSENDDDDHGDDDDSEDNITKTDMVASGKNDHGTFGQIKDALKAYH